MQTNLPMAAAVRFNESADGVVALPGALLLGRVGDLPDEVRQQASVALLPQQNAIRRKPVASGASRLLVILLDRFGQRKMNHGAHRCFINA